MGATEPRMGLGAFRLTPEGARCRGSLAARALGIASRGAMGVGAFVTAGR